MFEIHGRVVALEQFIIEVLGGDLMVYVVSSRRNIVPMLFI